ncbi:MAG: hypothetical protein Q9194_006095 [Teloschistes cf. exilis]
MDRILQPPRPDSAERQATFERTIFSSQSFTLEPGPITMEFDAPLPTPEEQAARIEVLTGKKLTCCGVSGVRIDNIATSSGQPPIDLSLLSTSTFSTSYRPLPPIDSPSYRPLPPIDLSLLSTSPSYRPLPPIDLSLLSTSPSYRPLPPIDLSLLSTLPPIDLSVLSTSPSYQHLPPLPPMDLYLLSTSTATPKRLSPRPPHLRNLTTATST